MGRLLPSMQSVRSPTSIAIWRVCPLKRRCVRSTRSPIGATDATGTLVVAPESAAWTLWRTGVSVQARTPETGPVGGRSQAPTGATVLRVVVTRPPRSKLPHTSQVMPRCPTPPSARSAAPASPTAPPPTVITPLIGVCVVPSANRDPSSPAVGRVIARRRVIRHPVSSRSGSTIREQTPMTERACSAEHWQRYLAKYSSEVLRTAPDKDLTEVSAAQRAAGWLGFDGASPDSIGLLERRLGVALPPSYRGRRGTGGTRPVSATPPTRTTAVPSRA